jgi:hypothetical protein
MTRLATADPTRESLTHAVTFTQAGAAVTLHTNSPAALAEARTTLYSYQQQAATHTPWHLELTQDVGVTTNITDGHTIDIGPQLFAHAHVIDGHPAFWVPDLTTLITTDPGRGTIRIRCATQDAARHWAPRLVRQAMTAQLLAAGMTYTHAAAFVCHGHGVLVTGHRGKGKTTTLLASLRHLGGDYVTNDRLLLHATNLRVRGFPWPMPLRAGIGTLGALPHLADLVPQHYRDRPTDEQWTCPHKIVIEPPEFPRLLRPDGTVADQMTPTLMIWPQLDPARTQVSIEPIRPKEVQQTLLRTRMFMTDPQRGTSAHTNHWLVPGPPDHLSDIHLEAATTALAATPCYRIHAGADPMALADAVGSLLDTTRLP